MKNFIAQRFAKKATLNTLVDRWVFNYLNRRSSKLIAKRGSPIAVFGNDWIGASIFIQGIYEEEDIEDFFALLPGLRLNLQEMTIVDVGANIGNHAIQFSKKFGRVFCFEPNPRTYEVLVSNTKRLGNVVSHNLGLGREKSSMLLKETWNNMGGSSARMNVASDSSVEVHIATLDELATSIGRVDVIKIDVEGMELDVLVGAKKVISENLPVVCLEQHDGDFMDEFNETAALDFLRSCGYKIFSLERAKHKPLLIRMLGNVYQLFFDSKYKRTVVEYERLPKDTYSMIYAVHPVRLLGINAGGVESRC